MYQRRWKGYTPEQVSERMKQVAANRFKGKTRAEKKAQAALMVEARGSWQVIKGVRKYVWKKREN